MNSSNSIKIFKIYICYYRCTTTSVGKREGEGERGEGEEGEGGGKGGRERGRGVVFPPLAFRTRSIIIRFRFCIMVVMVTP